MGDGYSSATPAPPPTPPTRAERMLAFAEQAVVLVQLVRDFAEHDDMKRGCQGETCPWCFAMVMLGGAEQAEKDVAEEHAAREATRQHFLPNPPDAQPSLFYVARTGPPSGSFIGRGYVHAWQPWAKRTLCGHWANPDWEIRVGKRAEVTCSRCKQSGF